MTESHYPGDDVIKEAFTASLDAFYSGQGAEGNVDCPGCGGAARLWYGVSEGELSVCCVMPQDECGLAYHWKKGQW